jgi:hypothetical protein
MNKKNVAAKFTENVATIIPSYEIANTLQKIMDYNYGIEFDVVVIQLSSLRYG